MDKAIMMIQEQIIKLQSEMDRIRQGTAIWRGKKVAADILIKLIDDMKETQSDVHN